MLYAQKRRNVVNKKEFRTPFAQNHPTKRKNVPHHESQESYPSDRLPHDYFRALAALGNAKG